MTLEAAVLKAIRDVLVPALDPLPVYDEPPQDAALPLVCVSGYVVRPDDTLEGTMLEHTITLLVVTAYDGKAEVLDALGKIRAALHRVTLTLDEHQAVSCTLVEAQTARIVEESSVSTQGMAMIAVRASDDD